jgi:hypothetical protein
VRLFTQLVRRQSSTAIALTAGVLVVAATACVVSVEDGEDVEVEETLSVLGVAQRPAPTGGKYQAYEEFLQRSGQGARSGVVVQAAPAGGASDSLQEYATKCDNLTGVHVPSFSCENGTEVPNQGNGVTCARPNVLNNRCDPGSKFQVLVRTTEAIVVAHCRKDGQPATGNTLYNDIAVIQYNKKNGAQCFYQALTNLNGAAVTAPSQGTGAGFPWLTPKATEAIHCTGCHDNGGLIRSEYLAQLTTGPNAFPNSDTGFDNNTIPVRYVGLDFVLNRSWSITGPTVVGNGAPCISCHRLAVNNYFAFGRINGTAGHFATQSTQRIQSSAITTTTMNGVTYSIPRWMRPGQGAYDADAEASAEKFEDCANGFWAGKTEANGGFLIGSETPGCTFTTLATSWDSWAGLIDLVTVASTAVVL